MKISEMNSGMYMIRLGNKNHAFEYSTNYDTLIFMNSSEFVILLKFDLSLLK